MKNTHVTLISELIAVSYEVERWSYKETANAIMIQQ